MPAERRPTYSSLAKPMKTERTHEENQERAYIAASRRSDRSLEARIESARRASDIHKKRTGRGLRVTEQDVINEEMYEEEDDDLPTQYLRLNAHLRTSSNAFNKKLQDYIVAQASVRNFFMEQQFPDAAARQYAQQLQQNGQLPTVYHNQPVFVPQNFSPTMPTFIHSELPYNPQALQQQQQQQQHQGFRQVPYSIPTRNNIHQRSASITTPLSMPNPGMPLQQVRPTVATPNADVNRRMSLPQNITEPQPAVGVTRPSLSRVSTANSVQKSTATADNTQNASTTTPKSEQATTPVKSEYTSPNAYEFPPLPFDDASSQVFSMTPFALSLPPETQQMVGPALDPQDPRTRLLMEGSENLAQPIMGTYTYNPNLSPKSARAGKGGSQTPITTQSAGMSQTLAPDTGMKLTTSVDNSGANTPPLGNMDDMFTNPSLYASNGVSYSGYFDAYQMPDSKLFNDASFTDNLEENSFINWD